MRKHLFACFFVSAILLLVPAAHAQVAINDNNSAPHASAMLDVNVFGVNKKGVLVPRVTTAQRLAIAAPATSLLVFDTNTNTFWYYGGSAWLEIISNTNNLWAANGADIYNTNTGNTGVGTGTAVKAKFHVVQNGTVLFGMDSTAINGSRFWFTGSKNALRIGNRMDVIFGADSWDYANIGINSVAFGTNNKSSGVASFSIGEYNHTSGSGSSALGWLNWSDGRGSFTTGYLNNALGWWSQAVGYANTASDDYSFAGGYGTKTFGESSFTFGREVYANSENMISIGRNNDTSVYANANKTSWVARDPLFVVGNGVSALNSSNAFMILKDGTTGIGNTKPQAALHVGANKTVIFGGDSLSSTIGRKLVWFGTKAALRFGRFELAGSTAWDYANIGVNSIAIGEGALASGPQSFSQGYYSNATGFYSFARGFAASANGDHSMAFGQNLTANGIRAMAFGESSYVSGDWSFSNGYDNVITGDYAASFGMGLRARPYNAFVVGRFNDSVIGSLNNAWVEEDPLFIIGNGSAFNNRRNALVVTKAGNLGIGNNFPGASLHVGTTTGATIQMGSVEQLSDFGVNSIGSNSSIVPVLDNTRSLGSGTNRWITVFAVNGTINTSDMRDKKNIRSIQYGLEDLMKLKPVSFEWNNQLLGEGAKLGLIAQDVLQVIPEVVKTHQSELADEKSGVAQRKELNRFGIFYSDLVPVLIKSIQEQQDLIIKQQQKMQELEKRLADLETRIK